MLSRAGGEFQLISGLVKQLNTDHCSLSETHEQVDEFGNRWLADCLLRAQETTRLLMTIEGLKETYARHIAIEEQEVFPLAGRVLTKDDLQLIATEMVSRRNLMISNPQFSKVTRPGV